jgi:anthranilate phosphoribosyltransferase
LPVGHEALSAPDPAASAEIIRRLFAGEPGPCRDTVIAGTAAALFLTENANSLRHGTELAAEAIDHGAAADKLAQLAGA